MISRLQNYDYFHKFKTFILSKLEGIKLTKLYYSIGEVASIFDVNTSLIRFWEKEFTQIQPKKNKKGERLFTVKDIELFNMIYQLVKGEGYTLDGAKKALKSKTVVVKTVKNSIDNNELIEKLEKIKAQLLQMK